LRDCDALCRATRDICLFHELSPAPTLCEPRPRNIQKVRNLSNASSACGSTSRDHCETARRAHRLRERLSRRAISLNSCIRTEEVALEPLGRSTKSSRVALRSCSQSPLRTYEIYEWWIDPPSGTGQTSETSETSERSVETAAGEAAADRSGLAAY